MRWPQITVGIIAGIVSVAVVGWLSQTYRGRPVVHELGEDSNGSNRLELVDVPVGFSFDGSQGYSFHSIVWKTNDASHWKVRKQILASEFQSGRPNRYEVSGVNSFNSKTGTAILKIVEGNAPENSPNGVSYNYSWREWNFLTNGEVRVIRQCANPFEKF